MTNEYTKHLCVSVPEGMAFEANQLAAVLGMSLGDLNTFDNFGHQTPSNIKCAIASNMIKNRVLTDVGSGLMRPGWDVDSVIDMGAANIAQSKMRFDFDDVENSITVSTWHNLEEFLGACQLTVIPWNPE